MFDPFDKKFEDPFQCDLFSPAKTPKPNDPKNFHQPNPNFVSSHIDSKLLEHDEMKLIGHGSTKDFITSSIETQRNAARKEHFPDADSRTESLRQAMQSGADYSPKDLHMVMFLGTDAERADVRSLLCSPEAIARNQDLALPHMKAALAGDERARNFIEQHRIIIEENMAAWVRPLWDKEAHASWRKLDLHGPAVNAYVKKLKSEIYPEYKFKFLPPLSLSDDPKDARRSMVTYLSGVTHLEMMNVEAESTLKKNREAVYAIMKEEVEDDLKTVHSPSIIGRFYRGVMKRENQMLFAACLVDDLVLALDLPLTESGKQKLWEGIRHSPWSITRTPAANEGHKILSTLKERGLDGEALTTEWERILFDPKAYKAYRRSQYTTNATAHSKTTAAVNATPQPTAKADDAIQAPNEVLPARSIRLEILAALESFQGAGKDRDSEARKLAKLVADSAQKFEETMNAIYRGVPAQELIDSLRASRPLSVLKAEANVEAPAPVETTQQIRARFLVIEEEKEPLQFTYTKEAKEALRDGQVRHTVAIALDRFSEHPELADRKKIKETTDIWELRLHRQALRLYYCHLGENQVLVLNIGTKNDQRFDIPKLQSIRDRER